MLSIDKSTRGFLKDGKHFFYLADTCWSAFTNIEEEDWNYYLNLRRQQGFNTLQINILPQWDACETRRNCFPLPTADKVHFQYTEWNSDYFAHARRMCLKAREEGFELALAVLWCNYVPGTWASCKVPENVIPAGFLESYLEKVQETFSDLRPVYLISGDTDFSAEANVYYSRALDYLKERSAESLFTFHIKGRYTKLPEEFAGKIDFYMYQSGHNAQPENVKMPYYLAGEFCRKEPKRPVINGEPCYEQMGYSRNMYGRFGRYEVRRAAWQSILGGACAGITYGAAGIYAWDTLGKKAPLSSEGFDKPNTWNLAVHYPGAWDYGYIPYLLEMYGIDSITPNQRLLAVSKEGMVAGSNKENNTSLIYVPYNTSVSLNGDFTGSEIHMIELETRNVCRNARSEHKDGITKLSMPPFEKDLLIIIMQSKSRKEMEIYV